MLLNVLANNTTAFLFYFEGSNHFLPFFQYFNLSINVMHTTIMKSIKLFILRFRIIALHSNVILLFTKREDAENRGKNERRTNNIR